MEVTFVWYIALCVVSVSDIKFKMAVNCAGKAMLSTFLSLDHIFVGGMGDCVRC